MSQQLALVLSLGLIVGAWVLTGRVRSYALAVGLLDRPNDRSSHTIARPRGGGIAIVVMALLAMPILGKLGVLSWPEVRGLAGGGALVAAIGFADDHRDISPLWRLAGQLAAAVWVVTELGGSPDVSILGHAFASGWSGRLFATIYLVWVSNLFNFMDGIDGIAGVETITVCVSAALISMVVLPGSSQWFAPIVLASATLGFLVWNWPPARIFMGDAGATFLGLMLGGLSLISGKAEGRLFWSWAILLGVFIVDATVTLAIRVIRRQRFYEAHRSHAYQQAAVRWHGHRPVTLTVGAINLCWLFPIALLVGIGRFDGLLATLFAYLPLILLALGLRAGRSNGKSSIEVPDGPRHE